MGGTEGNFVSCRCSVISILLTWVRGCVILSTLFLDDSFLRMGTLDVSLVEAFLRPGKYGNRREFCFLSLLGYFNTTDLGQGVRYSFGPFFWMTVFRYLGCFFSRGILETGKIWEQKGILFLVVARLFQYY